MSFSGTTQPKPEPPKSDHDLLIEIRDLLKLLVEATMNYPARR